MAHTSKTGAETIRWDLSDLFKSITDPKIESGLKKIATQSAQFVTTYKGKVAILSSQELHTAYQALETLMTPLYEIIQYAHLRYAIETDQSDIKAFVSKIDEYSSKISNEILFFDLELGALPEKTAKAHLASSVLKNYHYSIKRSIDTAKYNLSEKEEQLINLKDLTGKDALQKLYEELTSSFEFKFKKEGKVETLNGSQLRNLRQHKDKKVRRDAMKLFYSRYEEHQLVIGSLFNQIIKSVAIEKDLRGYQSSLQIKNISNDLDDKCIDTLHEVTTESYPLVHKYYALKKDLLNLPDMTLADIYAPLPTSDRFYTYDQAKKIVLDSFLAFDQEIHDMAKLMYDENRIDAPVLPKKRGGAFCSGYTPQTKPYVMLNFMGKQRDVSTMAHELGHAIHDMLSAQKQTLTNFHPILPLAETASVFAEMLVTDNLLKTETSTQAKIALLTDKLEDIFATSHRQNMFSKFEMVAHKEIGNRLLDSTELCTLYMAELKKMFGKSLKYPKEYQWEWSTIPHIFESPFYVYAYNFGNLFVMALYQQYLEEGASFIPKYKQLLAMGSSASPIEITKIVGVDITEKKFWQKSIIYIESLLTQLTELTKK